MVEAAVLAAKTLGVETAALLILAMNLLSLGVTLDIRLALLLALPMILNEIFLGIWLIVKGFNPPALAAGTD